MEVTRDVVLDLLPLYQAGEASADTRAIVEDFLRRDPSLKRLVEGDVAGAPPAPRSDLERATVERTRRLLRVRSWTLAFALFCTLIPFSFGSLSNGVRFVMMRDMPWSRWSWVVAAVLWMFFARLHQRTRMAGI